MFRNAFQAKNLLRLWCGKLVFIQVSWEYYLISGYYDTQYQLAAIISRL